MTDVNPHDRWLKRRTSKPSATTALRDALRREAPDSDRLQIPGFKGLQCRVYKGCEFQRLLEDYGALWVRKFEA